MKTDSPNYYRGEISQEDILALTNAVLAGIPYGLKTSFPDNPLIKQPITIIGFQITDYPDYTECYGIGNGECQWHPISGKFTGALLDLYAMTQGIERRGTFGIINVDYDKYPYPLIEYQYNTNPDENGEEIGWENYILKPYLIPFEYHHIHKYLKGDILTEYCTACKIQKDIDGESYLYIPTQKSINVLNKYHYDINGLIPKGLAHDATKQSHFIYENA